MTTAGAGQTTRNSTTSPFCNLHSAICNLNSSPPGITTSARLAPLRLEYKFLVHFDLLAELRAALRPYVRLDEFSAARPGNQYTVRSIYYDDRRFHCYQEKFDGFRLKKKLRIRGYDAPSPDAPVFLEIKYKQGDYIGKHRARLRWDQISSVFSRCGRNAGLGPSSRPAPSPLAGAVPTVPEGKGEGESVSRPEPAHESLFPPGSKSADAASRFLYHYHRRKMLPVVLIAYEREAFYSQFDSTLRLTFDKNVRSRLYPALGSLYQDRDAKFIMPDHFVFEVKFYDGCLPRWVSSVLTRFDLERLAVSKFGMGIDCQNVEGKFWRGVGHTVEFPGAGHNPRTRDMNDLSSNRIVSQGPQL